jgi:hypothetical protein
VDRTAYETCLRNLQSWARHLGATIESTIPQTLVELGPAGDEEPQDARNAADVLKAVSRSIDDVMNAFDSLLEAGDRPRRYDDFLQSLGTARSAADGDDDPDAEPDGEDEDEDEDETEDDVEEESLEINRARFARLVGELHYDVGWLLGAVHGALVCREEDHIDEHLDGLATGIDELMISYDRLQDVIGILPPRHCAFFDRMVVLEDEHRHRRRHH